MSHSRRIDVYLICNAKYHDTNFARLELLKLLAEHEDVMVRVAEDYSDIAAIQASRLLITYTCELCPSDEQLQGLKKFLADGGRWYALHGTNAMAEFVGPPLDLGGGIVLPGKALAPDKAPLLMEMLGSRFVAHPPYQTLQVTIADPAHPMVKGIEPFEIYDEPYYFEYKAGIKPLLEARYSASCPTYVHEHWEDTGPRPQLYLNPYGKGEVLYLLLGHCRGKYDLQPFMDICPIDRCAWEYPVFYELLRRGIRWGIGALEPS